MLRRETVKVKTKYGEITVKSGYLNERIISPSRNMKIARDWQKKMVLPFKIFMKVFA